MRINALITPFDFVKTRRKGSAPRNPKWKFRNDRIFVIISGGKLIKRYTRDGSAAKLSPFAFFVVSNHINLLFLNALFSKETIFIGFCLHTQSERIGKKKDHSTYKRFVLLRVKVIIWELLQKIQSNAPKSFSVYSGNTFILLRFRGKTGKENL